MIAKTFNPPYVMAVFTSIRTEVEEGYDDMNELTFAEIKKMDGFLGYEAFRDNNGFGVNVSYWKDMISLKNWKENILHNKAQALGKEKWYKQYKLRIGTVNRDYDFKKDTDE